jgi:hypothetical protein
MAVAQRPLRVGELIEACIWKLEVGGQVYEDQRLSPEQIVSLLRHLVVVHEYADLTPTTAFYDDRLVFAHFSVMEYLTTPEYMAPDLRPSFAIDLKRDIMKALTVQMLVKVVATAAFSAYNPFSN